MIVTPLGCLQYRTIGEWFAMYSTSPEYSASAARNAATRPTAMRPDPLLSPGLTAPSTAETSPPRRGVPSSPARTLRPATSRARQHADRIDGIDRSCAVLAMPGSPLVLPGLYSGPLQCPPQCLKHLSLI